MRSALGVSIFRFAFTFRFFRYAHLALCLFVGACAKEAIVDQAPAAPEPRPRLETVDPNRKASGDHYDISTDESLVVVRVYRSGRLATMGHNHVLSTQVIQGTITLDQSMKSAQASARIPVDTFNVDDPALRLDAGPEFASVPSPSAISGTRRNLLGPSVLDAESHPYLSLSLSAPVDLAAEKASLPIAITLKDETRVVPTRVRYTYSRDRLSLSGELRLSQTEFGMTPFSVLGGALAVRDELEISYRVVATRRETTE